MGPTTPVWLTAVAIWMNELTCWARVAADAALSRRALSIARLTFLARVVTILERHEYGIRRAPNLLTLLRPWV